MKEIKILTEPTVFVLADMQIRGTGCKNLARWLGAEAPDCLPDDWEGRLRNADEAVDGGAEAASLLFSPERNTVAAELLSDNELLAELAGRACYNSFGAKAGRADNAVYLANTMGSPGKIPHNSIMYHAKMTFLFGGISRRMSHELIRHYVGADRSEEGAPSQVSSRYTEHPGHFVAHPRMLATEGMYVQESFKTSMQAAYDSYLRYLNEEVEHYKQLYLAAAFAASLRTSATPSEAAAAACLAVRDLRSVDPDVCDLDWVKTMAREAQGKNDVAQRLYEARRESARDTIKEIVALVEHVAKTSEQAERDALQIVVKVLREMEQP